MGVDVRVYRAYIWGRARISWFGAHIHPTYSFRAYTIRPCISRFGPRDGRMGGYISTLPPSLPLPLPLLSPFVLSFSSLIPLASALPALNICADNNFLSQSAAHTCGYHIYTRCRDRGEGEGSDGECECGCGGGSGGEWEWEYREGCGEVRLSPVFSSFLFWKERIHRLSLRLSTRMPTPCRRSSFPSLLFTYIHIRV
jgi:hypothetical protein